MRHVVLDLLAEDWHGLWEIEWRTKKVLSVIVVNNLDGLLREEVAGLIEEGKAALVVIAPSIDEERELSSSEGVEIVAAASSWAEPSANEQTFWLRSTPSGDEEYRLLTSRRYSNPE